MVSPVHGDYRRCQAEIPLIVLCRFPGPALGMLKQLLRLEKERTPKWSEKPWPVAWKELDYRPSKSELPEVVDRQKGQWNIEQATRRALRNLEKRGLVELGPYAFMQEADIKIVNISPELLESPELREILVAPQMQTAVLEWYCIDIDNHIPGQSRIMTGVLLTDKGRRLAESV
jgi:hypothetical protein